MRKKYDQTDQRIRQAAIEIYSHSNRHRPITVDTICRKADIHRNTFYTHFDSVDQLIKGMVEEYLERAHVLSYGRAIGSLPEKREEHRVKAMADLLNYHLDNRETYLALFTPVRHEHWSSYRLIISKDMLEAKRRLGYDADILRPYVGDMCSAAISEATYRWLLEGREKAEDIAEMFIKTLRL